MRLVPNDQVSGQIHKGKDGVALINNITITDIIKKRVVVTTFLTATNLKQKEIYGQQLEFSHILIDEGGQAREPESIGALAVVKEETKIVIVGDHMQVSNSRIIKMSTNYYCKISSFRVVLGQLC